MSTQHQANLLTKLQRLLRFAFRVQEFVYKPGVYMPSREYPNRRMWVRASLPVSSTHTKYSRGNCNTWAMNAVLNSMHLSLATCCTFFLVNPFLRNTRHTVLPDTITPVASYIAWHISRKYRDGFSCIIAIMNSSWWPSSFRTSSLRGCFSGATFPVSLNLEKMRCAVLGAEFVIAFLSVQKLNPCQVSAIPLSIQYRASKPSFVQVQHSEYTLFWLLSACRIWISRARVRAT